MKSEQPPLTGCCLGLAVVLFCLSGITNYLVANEIDLRGAFNPVTAFQSICMTFTQILMTAFTALWSEPRFTKDDFWRPFPYWYILVLDILYSVLFQWGLSLVGSGLATVIYSSITIFSAIFSRVIYGKILSWLKVVSLIIIVGSISVTADGQIKNVGAGQQVVGILLIVASCICSALEYVLVENVLLKKFTPMATSMIYWPNLVLYGLWIGFYVGLQWDKLVLQPIREKNGNYSIILLLYLGYSFSMGTHQMAWFNSLRGGRVAAVSSAVNKVLQAVLVFFISDIFYCPSHPWNQHRATQQSQCINTWKLAGFGGVMFGVMIYSFDGLRRKPERSISDLEDCDSVLLEDDRLNFQESPNLRALVINNERVK